MLGTKMQRVVDRAAGRVPVVASGTFGGPIKEQAEFITEMYKVQTQHHLFFFLSFNSISNPN